MRIYNKVNDIWPHVYIYVYDGEQHVCIYSNPSYVYVLYICMQPKGMPSTTATTQHRTQTRFVGAKRCGNQISKALLCELSPILQICCFLLDGGEGVNWCGCYIVARGVRSCARDVTCFGSLSNMRYIYMARGASSSRRNKKRCLQIFLFAQCIM